MRFVIAAIMRGYGGNGCGFYNFTLRISLTCQCIVG